MNVEAPGGPGSINPRSGAVGIAQWLGKRKAGITSSTSFDDQLAHVLKEIDEDAPGAAEGAGRLLKEAKTPEEGARAATAYERAENYEKAGHGPHEDDWTAKTLRGIDRVEKAINGVGKKSTPPRSGQEIIPGQGDPHKPGFDPSSVPFHHTSLFPLGHQHFASSEHHDNRSVHSNIEVKVAGVYPIGKTAHPLERTKNATLIRNTTATAA